MPPFVTRDKPSYRCYRRAVLGVLLCSVMAGCHVGRSNIWNPFQQTASPPPRVFSIQPTVEEVIGHLNQKSSRLVAWRTTDARIRAKGTPIALSATVAVARPRNLRVMARSPAGSEVDFGSNAEQFWFWARRNEVKHVFHARHEELDRARTHFEIPFQPDWLMSALGIGQIDPGEYALNPAVPGQPTLELVADRIDADGRRWRHVILVDSHLGHVVAQTVTDETGSLIARATFADHRQEPMSGVWRPHHIELEWPHSELALPLTIGQIEVNPPAMPEQIFARPDIPGYPPFDLGSLPQVRHVQGLARESHRPSEPIPTTFGRTAVTAARSQIRERVSDATSSETPPFADEVTTRRPSTPPETPPWSDD